MAFSHRGRTLFLCKNYPKGIGRKNYHRVEQKGRVYMGVSKNRGGPPKSSILVGFSIINHPFWGNPIFGNIHIYNNSLIIHQSSSSFFRKSSIQRSSDLRTRYQRDSSPLSLCAHVLLTLKTDGSPPCFFFPFTQSWT